MRGKIHSRELLEKIYDILVKVGGAHENYRFNFVHHHRDEKFPCHEWRFMGYFGFGGKYRVERNAIDYYPENETPELNKKRDEVNEALRKFDEEMGVIRYD